MTNELPDVKFENFAAAKACLQNILTSTGALVKELSILSDQNGKANWVVYLSPTGSFPAPTPDNFVRVRAVLNQHIPHCGVLRQITRICKMSTTEEWLWMVTYGVNKTSRLKRAINALSSVIKKVTPCLKSSPQLQTAIRKRERLSNLEHSKNRKRFFYQLRHKKSAPSGEAGKSESKADCAYSTNFVKAEVLQPNKTVRKMTKTTHFAPNYDQWDVNALFFYMKNITITDAKAMHIITTCNGTLGDVTEYAAAVYHLKNRCPHLKATQLPQLFKGTLERLRIDESYISSVSMVSDLFTRVSVRDHSYYYASENHTLCSHN